MPHNSRTNADFVYKSFCSRRCVVDYLSSVVICAKTKKTTTNKLLVIYPDSVIQQYCWVCNKTHYLPHFNFWDVQRPRMHDHACMICVFYFIFSSGLAEISWEKRMESYYLTSIILTFDLFLCCFMFKILFDVEKYSWYVVHHSNNRFIHRGLRYDRATLRVYTIAEYKNWI